MSFFCLQAHYCFGFLNVRVGDYFTRRQVASNVLTITRMNTSREYLTADIIEARRLEGLGCFRQAAELYRAIGKQFDADRCEINHEECLLMAREYTQDR